MKMNSSKDLTAQIFKEYVFTKFAQTSDEESCDYCTMWSNIDNLVLKLNFLIRF